MEAAFLETFIGKTVSFGKIKTQNNIHMQFFHNFCLWNDGSILCCPDPKPAYWAWDEDKLVFMNSENYPLMTFSKFEQINGWPFLHMTDGPFFITPNKPASTCRIKYVVSSHVGFKEKTLPRVLFTMRDSGIKDEDIWVTVAGAKSDYITKELGVPVSYRTINAYEYTGLHDAAIQKMDCDYIVLLHDTCDCGSRFKTLIEAVNVGAHFDYIQAIKDNHFNIGLYSIDFLKRIEPRLLKLDGCSKDEAIDIELCRRPISFTRSSSLYATFPSGTRKEIGIVSAYGGVQRMKEYLHGVDVYKYLHRSPGGV